MKRLHLFLLFCLVAFSSYLVYQKVSILTLPSSFHIDNFNYDQDMDIITQLTKDNWTFLAPNTPYNPTLIDIHFKDQTSFNFYPKKVIIKVLKKDSKVIGFVTYIMATDTVGHIELLAIDSQQQHHGYGTQLVNFAINDLKNNGAQSIEIYVMQENTKAQQLYNKLSFACSEFFEQMKVFRYTKKL